MHYLINACLCKPTPLSSELYKQHDSCLTNTNYLDSGATWEFTATCFDPSSGDVKYKNKYVAYR